MKIKLIPGRTIIEIDTDNRDNYEKVMEILINAGYNWSSNEGEYYPIDEDGNEIDIIDDASFSFLNLQENKTITVADAPVEEDMPYVLKISEIIKKTREKLETEKAMQTIYKKTKEGKKWTTY